MTRREMLKVMAATLAIPAEVRSMTSSSRFATRGVVLYPWDLSLRDWPERAAAAGINAIGLHAARRLDLLVDFVGSEEGATFLDACRDRRIGVEYELHAMGDLLSREHFSRDPDLFRMDPSGRRNPDCNCCPSSEDALAIVADRAVAYGRLLRPTTGNYYYWSDDGGSWCSCPKCKGWSASEQAVVVENTVVEALRKRVDPAAMLCHIAYHLTLEPPRQVTPHEGLFLEFAPISRRYDRSIAEREVALSGSAPGPATHGGLLDILDENLEIFGRDTAQALEYWLDVSKFSEWRRPARELPWDAGVVARDAEAYAARGMRHVKSFATWIDADYVERFGEPPLEPYVRALNGEAP